MKKYIVIFASLLIICGCQKIPETSVPEVKVPTQTPVILDSSPNLTAKIEVPKLANKSADEIDKIFGAPAEAKDIENGGKFRLYKSPEYPKGLAIRFYGGRAKSFNLLLEKPAANSKEAILKNLGIDVGNAVPTKDAKEPLTEIFQGTFGGVKFTKISVKKQENGGGFIFVFAEIAP